MRLIIILACILVLASCETDQQRIAKVMEKQIRETIEIDWHDGIPFDDLVDAENICHEHPLLRGCDAIHTQMLDISTSFVSCRADLRSSLCQAIVKGIKTHPILSRLPQAKPILLPDNPFYWKLPTRSLEVQSGHFQYRQESAIWFWLTWKIHFFACGALLLTIYIIWFGFSKSLKDKKKRAELQKIEQAKQIEQGKIARIQQERARIEAELQAKLKIEAATAEQNRLATKHAAERKLAEAAAALAAEQAEAQQLLLSIVKSPKSKRKN